MADNGRATIDPRVGLPESTSGSVLKHDGPVAIVVFLVALPLCLGIALASGAPLIAGVTAGVVGGILVGALSGSNVSVSGPAASLVVIVLTATQRVGSYRGFLVAVVLAGLLQIVFGLLKFGEIADYVPNSVIKGMLAGIGVIIILKQIPHALGEDSDFEGDFSFLQFGGNNTLSELAKAVVSASLDAVIIFAVGLALMFLWDRAAGNAHLSACAWATGGSRRRNRTQSAVQCDRARP